MEAIAIATLAFIGLKAADTTVGKLTEAALEKADQLRKKLWDKLRGNGSAEVALQGAENGSKADLEALADYLKIAMREDPQFAGEVQKLAQEIDEEIDEDPQSMIMKIYGGTGYQTSVKANTSFVGGTHHHHSDD